MPHPVVTWQGLRGNLHARQLSVARKAGNGVGIRVHDSDYLACAQVLWSSG